MNTFLELAETRYSVRNFADRQIEKEHLERILRAGQVAPTAANRQPQRIVVIQSPETIEVLRKITPYTFNAPTVLLICADMRNAWVGVDGHNSAPIDAAIVITHMMLQAWDDGIGSCWVRGFDKNNISRAFNLPESIEPIALLPIGYPSEKAKPAKGWHDNRMPIEQTVKFI